MSDQLKNILIGLFATLSIVVTVCIILFLKPSVGDGKKTVHVRFSNISGINIGTRVSFAGKPVGEVTDILEVFNAREDQTDILGRVYFYQLTLKVDSSVQIYDTDKIAVLTTGLMGEKSIGIIPKANVKGEIPRPIHNQIVYAQSVDSWESTMHKFSQLTNRIEGVVDNFDNWFIKNSDNLSSSVASLSSLMETAKDENVVTTFQNTISTINENMKLINNSLLEVQDNELMAKFNFLLNNISNLSDTFSKDGSKILENVNELTQNLASTNNTFGRIFNNDDFYLRFNAMVNKADILMNDINHYGVLFQYDKHWQRLRTKRANILASLNSPKQFKEYYQTELNEITASLNRISSLVEKAENIPQKEKIAKSPLFKKDFAELIKQVDHLMDNIKLYNQDLQEATNQ